MCYVIGILKEKRFKFDSQAAHGFFAKIRSYRKKYYISDDGRVKGSSNVLIKIADILSLTISRGRQKSLNYLWFAQFSFTEIIQNCLAINTIFSTTTKPLRTSLCKDIFMMLYPVGRTFSNFVCSSVTGQ